MPFIENVAAAEVVSGSHRDPGPNSVLISINDDADTHPRAKHKFAQRHNFYFLDLEDNDACDEDVKISDCQAKGLVNILQKALDNDMNVIVHCTVGVCRSGAVTEVGCIMGFEDTGRYRQPNLRVKYKMMKALGLAYE